MRWRPAETVSAEPGFRTLTAPGQDLTLAGLCVAWGGLSRQDRRCEAERLRFRVLWLAYRTRAYGSGLFVQRCSGWRVGRPKEPVDSTVRLDEKALALRVLITLSL